jgi:hypothetical protein
MPISLEVEQSVISVPCTASIETIKADIETGVIVLGTVSTKLNAQERDRIVESKDTYNRIEALGAILSIHSLGRTWGAEI